MGWRLCPSTTAIKLRHLLVPRSAWNVSLRRSASRDAERPDEGSTLRVEPDSLNLLAVLAYRMINGKRICCWVSVVVSTELAATIGVGVGVADIVTSTAAALSTADCCTIGR